MSSGRSSIVSILNNDDNPSFAVRSTPRLSRTQASPSYHPPHSAQLPPPASEPHYTRPDVMSKSTTASPRGTRHPFNAVTEAVQPVSPGSSDGSAYDYMTSQPSAYHPYARQDPRRDPYRFPGRDLATPQTPPDTRSSTSETASQTGATRGTGRKNKYPCPYAASHGCAATFTTSGHAARHGKKHTGEKSVHCPICNKAFTRKDNMKQHIRTHRTHSDEIRSVSEPDNDVRWTMARSEAYAPASHQRNLGQPLEAGVRPPPGPGSGS